MAQDLLYRNVVIKTDLKNKSLKYPFNQTSKDLNKLLFFSLFKKCLRFPFRCFVNSYKFFKNYKFTVWNLVSNCLSTTLF